MEGNPTGRDPLASGGSWGQRLRTARESAGRHGEGWTQDRLSRASGVGRVTISRLEHDAVTYWRPEWMVALAQALGYDPHQLFPLHAVVPATPPPRGARTRRARTSAPATETLAAAG